MDVILVPIGGGGLASGVSTLAKLLNPNVTVIGVEPTGAASMKASVEAGHVVTLDRVETIADGVAVKTPGDQIFPYIQKNIDDIITIDDDELVDAFLDMMEKHKMIVENAGLLPIAALYHLKCKGKNVVPCPLRRQHGRDHRGLPGAARADQRGRVSPSPSSCPTVPASCCGWPRSWPRPTATSSGWSTTSSSTSTARAAWSCGSPLEAFGHAHKKTILEALRAAGYQARGAAPRTCTIELPLGGTLSPLDTDFPRRL